MKFTDRQVKALKPQESRYEAWETNGKGLGIRVAPTGRKSWIFMYRFEGRSRRMTLGSYPSTSVAEAHVSHSKARNLLDRGQDPGAKLVDQKRRERNSSTVIQLAEEYIERWAKPTKRSWLKDQQALAKDVLPYIGRCKAKDVTRRQIIHLLDQVVERGSPIQANRTLALVRKMFNFAINRDIVEFNPCQALSAPEKERRRDRVLSDQEIAYLWNGLEKSRFSLCIANAIRFQLLTAQRKGEVISAEWGDIDLVNGWWTIPAEKSKNGLSHRVPLSSSAILVLEEQQRETIETRWVFPSPKGGQPLGGTAVNHALKRNMELYSEEPFVPHDLRRTAASHMTSLGVSRLVVSKVLNHAEPGVTAVYDRHSYDREKIEALDLWRIKLQQIVASEQ
jgi:integrase